MTLKEIFENCTVEGTVIKLPNVQLERKIYIEVAKSLELIGGKWKSGKTQGFVFQTNPTNLLYTLIAQFSDGDKNLKKDYQYFATPEKLADYLVSLSDLAESHKILEPSAGQGSIVKSINKTLPEKKVSCYEAMPTNIQILKETHTVEFLGEDFLEATPLVFDRIIANPPFRNNQDIDHIRKMYDCLKVGGRLVSIASKHWIQSTNKKETMFKDWLLKIGASIEEISSGTFKESGTNIETVIIVINKKKDKRPKKLIRSKTLPLIEGGNWEKIVDKEELNNLYHLKALEELGEIKDADHKDLMEFVDLVQVAYSYAYANGFTHEQVQDALEKKASEKGIFEDYTLNNLNPTNLSDMSYLN